MRVSRARTTRSSRWPTACGAPIVHALRGKEFIEYDNPFDVGMTGLLGFASGYRAMEAADALLMLGSDFPYEQFYPEAPRRSRSTSAASSSASGIPLDLGLVGDVGATAAALLPRLAEKERRDHLDDATAHYRKTRAKLDDLASADQGGTPDPPAVPRPTARPSRPRMTRSSPPTSARPSSGPPATCR